MRLLSKKGGTGGDQLEDVMFRSRMRLLRARSSGDQNMVELEKLKPTRSIITTPGIAAVERVNVYIFPSVIILILKYKITHGPAAITTKHL